jgi:hypothetical protein
MKGHWEKVFGVILKNISSESLALRMKEIP